MKSQFAPGVTHETPMLPEDDITNTTSAQTDWQALYWEAERARQEAETQVQYLTQVVSGLRDGLVMLDSELRYRYVNPFTLELMGMQEEQVIGKSFHELYPDLIGTPYALGMETALREQRTVEVDIFYPNNSRFWRTIINPVDDGLTVYYRDVTEFKAAEIIQQRLAAIVQSSDDAIIGKTLDGIITNWNPGAERIFGYTAAEVIGKPKTILFPPERLGEEVLILERLRQGIPTDHIETVRVRKDGTQIWVSLTISPIRDGSNQIVGASTIARDITQRKKVETNQALLAQSGELLASSLDYQKTLQSVAQLLVPQLADWCVIHLLNEKEILEQVCVAHADPTKTEHAQQYSRLYPPNPEDPHGPYAVLKSGKTEWSPQITESMIRAVVVDEEQYQILMQAGMRSYISVPLIAHDNRLGVMTLIVGETGQYTTEDVIFAEEIARHAAMAVENARLYLVERERSDQLIHAISEVHHRVKNSLQSVSALLEMQMPLTGNSLPLEAVQDSLYQIKTIALVHDLLARDKPIGTVDAAQVLTNLAVLLSSGMSAGRQQVVITVDAKSLEMSTRTATSLALLVNELLTNAVKHQFPLLNGSYPDDLSPTDIQVTLQQKEDYISLTVEDKGPGFPPDFDPVLHANIGLQLVHTLAEHDLHGTIQFRNRTDRDTPAAILGASVEVCFPASACIEN